MLTRLKSTVLRFSILCCAASLGVVRTAAIDSKEPIRIQVDATDTVHKVFSVTEFIPLHDETSITLFYPRWELASHAPTISVADLAGLEYGSVANLSNGIVIRLTSMPCIYLSHTTHTGDFPEIEQKLRYATEV